VSDDKTILLYALSTLAQSCAALAAFVGAVGLFRLQSLRDQHRDAERELHVLAGRLTGREQDRIPLEEVLGIVKSGSGRGTNDPNVPAARKLHAEWTTFPSRRRDSSRALMLFEVWNLLVIGVALVGFNHVTALAVCPWTLRALWPVALGTIAVTIYCVFAWTKEA
jgi:hypothetical protein